MIDMTSFMIPLSGEKIEGKNQGITVPMDPNIVPLKAPTITKDFNSIRACMIPKKEDKTKISKKINVLKLVILL